jgi:hypothetical protein
MNDRQALMVALGGPSMETEKHAEPVLGVAFELIHAEAEALLDSLDGSAVYSRMVGLCGRLKALEAFIGNHVEVSFRTDGSAEPTESEAEKPAEQGPVARLETLLEALGSQSGKTQALADEVKAAILVLYPDGIPQEEPAWAQHDAFPAIADAGHALTMLYDLNIYERKRRSPKRKGPQS